MRKLLVALTLGLLSAAVVGAQKKQTDREFEGLKGPVKSVSVEHAASKEQEGRQAEGPRVMAEGATYNAEGNLVVDEWYGPGGTLFMKTVYVYIGAEKIAEVNVRPPSVQIPAGTVLPAAPPRPSPGPGPMLRSWEKLKYKYDARGNITERIVESEGRVKRRGVYKFQAGRKELQSYADGKDLDYRRVERLDARGNVVELEVFEIKADFKEKHSYTAYEFDARGNWIKRLKSEWTTEGGKPRYVPVQVEYRTIAYF